MDKSNVLSRIVCVCHVLEILVKKCGDDECYRRAVAHSH